MSGAIRWRRSPEDIQRILRRVDEMKAQGTTVKEALEILRVDHASYSRWKRKVG